MKYDPLNDGISSVEYVAHSGDDLMAVNAARVSLDGYDDWIYVSHNDGETKTRAEAALEEQLYDYSCETYLPERSKKLLRYLIKHGHWSPFDQPYLTVRMKVPIFVRTQIYRHWTLKPNEVSGRYVELKDECYVPADGAFRKQAPSNRQASVADDGTLPQNLAHLCYEQAFKEAYEAYQTLLSLGVTREQARGVLPQSMYTECLLSGTLRSWLHFLSARIHPGAQHETQLYAEAVREIVREHFPEVLAAYEEIKAEEAK